MPFLQARAGIALAGVTRAGWSPPTVQVRIAGVDRTANVKYENFSISQVLDGQATAKLAVEGFTPAVGNEILITYKTPNNYLFAGTIMRRRWRSNGSLVRWELDCTDYQWLLDRYALVTASYASCGYNTAVARLLADFTDPASGFFVGTIPQDLGDLDATGITFTQARVSEAISQLMAAANAHYVIRPTRQIDAFAEQDFYVANSISISNATDVQDLEIGEDLHLLQTSAIVEGYRAIVHAAAAAGAMAILVPAAAAFDPAGGTVRIGTQVIAYTSMEPTSDPVTGEPVAELTLAGALAADVPSGTPVVVLETADNAGAQADLATALGGGQSGIARGYREEPRSGTGVAARQAATDVARFGGSDGALADLTYESKSFLHRVGKSITMVITSPITFSGNFLIQRVDYRIWGVVAGTEARLARRVTAAPGRQSLPELLAATLRRTGLAS